MQPSQELKHRYTLVEPLRHQLATKGINLPTEDLLSLLERNRDDIESCVKEVVDKYGEKNTVSSETRCCYHFWKDWWFPQDNKEQEETD